MLRFFFCLHTRNNARQIKFSLFKLCYIFPFLFFLLIETANYLSEILLIEFDLLQYERSTFQFCFTIFKEVKLIAAYTANPIAYLFSIFCAMLRLNAAFP